MSAQESNTVATTEQQQEVAELATQVEDIVLGPDGNPLSKKALKKLEKEREKEQRRLEREAREAAERAAREASEVDCAKENYGKAPINMSQVQSGTKWTEIKDLSAELAGQTVHVQARVQGSRPTGNKMCFLVLREGSATAQGLLVVDNETISKQMVKFANSISSESLVSLVAKVVVPSEPVKSCTVGDVELHVSRLFVISE
ncbi:aspartate--tRNA ligase dps1, partial [Coemansia sp. RSA 455]